MHLIRQEGEEECLEGRPASFYTDEMIKSNRCAKYLCRNQKHDANSTNADFCSSQIGLEEIVTA